jgi:hypothetical protein
MNPQTITPERQIAASQVGAVFNSMHEYLRALQPKDAEGNAILSKHLEFAHCRVDEAAMWAIKSVLAFGVPPRPAPAAAPPADAAANSEGAEAAKTDATADTTNTPAPIGVVDPPQDFQGGAAVDDTPENDARVAALPPETTETLPTDNATGTEPA